MCCSEKYLYNSNSWWWLSLFALQSSFFPDNSSVVDTNDRVKAIEKVGRQDFPSGYGEDSGGGNTVKLLESTVARFGPIASFRGTYRANRWTLPIALENTSGNIYCKTALAIINTVGIIIMCMQYSTACY